MWGCCQAGTQKSKDLLAMTGRGKPLFRSVHLIPPSLYYSVKQGTSAVMQIQKYWPFFLYRSKRQPKVDMAAQSANSSLREGRGRAGQSLSLFIECELIRGGLATSNTTEHPAP